MQATVTRRGVLRRIGAGVVGVSAAGVLADRQAHVASAAPVCCSGGTCPRPGCPPADPECCWYCTTASCHTFKCCDRDCNGNCRPDCTAAIYVGPC